MREDTSVTIDWGAINWLAVGAAVIVNMVLGALWYSPVLLGKPWMKANGFTDESIKGHKSEATKGYVVAVIASIVTAITLAVLAQLIGADTLAEGLMLGLWVSIGLVFFAIAVNYVFEFRPMSLILINAGYPVVGQTIMAVILAAWK